MPYSLDLVDPAVTNIVHPARSNGLTSDEKRRAIAGHMKGIMEVLGLDLEDDSLKDTPERIARMYVDEIFSGLDTETFPRMTFVENRCDRGNEPQVIVVKAGFVSFCEHHFVPMMGEVTCAYIPKDKLIGLSKIPRIVRYFAKRPQIQERFTAQVADCLSLVLETEDVAVITVANHLCVQARGVEDEQNETQTRVLKGQFREKPDLLH